MLLVGDKNLNIQDVVNVAQKGEIVSLSKAAIERVATSNQWINDIIASEVPVYGVNTGYGIFANRNIPVEQTIKLNRNLILSHSVATGDDLPHDVVRAAMLIRANTLAFGYSGVRLEIITTLLDMLNFGITPAIPMKGSLGSSGDLAPLSHLALVFTKDEADQTNESGWAYYKVKRVPGKEAMSEAGLERLILQAKEGLALTNGATFSAAIAALACSESLLYLDIADLNLSACIEALLSPKSAYDQRIHELRSYPGQVYVARRVNELTKGSTLVNAGGKIQDAYSLRCAPQVHGAVRDTWIFVTQNIERELNAVTDNPIVLGPGEVISGGNFHGEPVGLAMDYLGIAMAELGSISERRIFRLTDEKLNLGLPPMLVDNHNAAGINSGMMMPQYTAASLVLENQSLATPDSVHSLPTSGEQEDHNANAMTAARHCMEIIHNTAHILAIELYCCMRALDLRLRTIPEARLGDGVGSAYRAIRSQIPYRGDDHLRGPEIDEVHSIIRDLKI